MALPRPPPKKILSCGIVAVHFDGERYRLLAIRSFGSWDFPKALVTGGQNPLQVAMDEAREATGLSDLELNWGEDAFRETIAFEDGSVGRYYLAQSKTAEVTLRVPPGDGAQEDFEYRWVTLEEAEEILPPRLALVLDWVVQQLASGAS
jgi:8-oxo-dGTP pyrophosphatase MutT (NUDIX family)